MKYEEYLKAVGRKITDIRTEADMTLNKAAQAAFLRWTQLRDIEEGVGNPNMKTYKKIADALKIEFDELFIIDKKKRKK